MTAAETGDMKTFATMTAIAKRSSNGARGGLRELKQTPFLRANRQAEAEFAQATCTDTNGCKEPRPTTAAPQKMEKI